MKMISCIDTETTGLDKSKDRILQLAVIKFNPETGDEIVSKDWYIKPSGQYTISPAAEQIHGISRDFIETHGVSLRSIFDELMEILKDSDILTYNGTTFDVAFLQREFEREGLDPAFWARNFIDSYDIEKRVNSNKLGDVYRRYYGEDFEDAHNAFADVRATISVYMAQKSRISQDTIQESVDNTTKCSQSSPEGFVKFNKDGVLVFNVGKYKEYPVAQVCQTDPGYIRWLWSGSNGENIITIPTKRAIKEEYGKVKKSL